MDIIYIKETDLKNDDFIIEISGSSDPLRNGLHKIVSINPMPEPKKQSKSEPYWLWYQKRGSVSV